jgi:hypothetical protein
MTRPTEVSRLDIIHSHVTATMSRPSSGGLNLPARARAAAIHAERILFVLHAQADCLECFFCRSQRDPYSNAAQLKKAR